MSLQRQFLFQEWLMESNPNLSAFRPQLAVFISL